MFSLVALVCCTVGPELVAAACNQDNCYRALFPTNNPSAASTASAFCNTYTTTINTKTTGFPNPAIATGCQTKRSRISSACSCNPLLPTRTTVPTGSCLPTPPINIVKNGGFECEGYAGYSPWVLNQTSFADCGLYSVGDDSRFAFRCLQYNAGSQTNVPSTLTQNVAITVGKTYILTYRVYFGQCGPSYNGVIRVRINGVIVDSQNACNRGDNNPLQYVYLDFAAGFTATVNPTVLRFEWLSPGPDIAPEITIDNVVIGPSNP